MNTRRFVLRGFGAAALFAAFPLRAQQAQKIYRVAYIASISPASELAAMPGPRDLVQGLRALGYVEGRNLAMEWRSAEGKLERLPEIVRELVAAKVDVIVTVGAASRAAKDVTQTVPIVMATSASPVESGLVQSLARPGGNVTGLTVDPGPEITGKRLQLLKEIYPDMARVAYLASKADAGRAGELRDAEAAAKELGASLFVVEHTPTQYADAFARIKRERVNAILPANTMSNYANRRLIVDFANKNKLLAAYPVGDYVEAGGLIAYGVNSADMLRRAAGYVDRILRGEKPGDMPIEQPMKFELVINMKTAKALRIKVPQSILLRADRVIE
jgi:putative ABC transport system substrate-binding protein